MRSGWLVSRDRNGKVHNRQVQPHERLRAELDVWADAGMTARLWWRDDDTVADTPQLRRLLGIARNAGIVVALGVVPERADDSLVSLVVGTDCCIWQHGWGHHFHTAGEFGEGRPIGLMLREALSGQQALDRLFGPSRWQRVFVPPNHMLSLPFKSLLPGLGYLGVSAGLPLTPPLEHVVEVNAEIDVMNWPKGMILGEDTIYDMLIEQLVSRRTGDVPVERPIGLLTHHLVFDAEAWGVTRRVIEWLRAHSAVNLCSADTSFFTESAQSRSPYAGGSTFRSGAAPRAMNSDITVVLTSCGRPDLLARTLDSFIANNTCPLRDIVVMEDGASESTLSRDERYRRCNIRWLCTGRRIGQMPAIDVAYRLVESEYLFHCEDDWEFLAPGFMERSLTILEHNPHILQVWLRALDDTNRHPVAERVFHAGDVPYRLMQPGFDSGEWGIWHGFSFNPGLRRRADYERLGSFGSLDPHRQKRPYEIERDASEFYVRQGLLAATLIDNEGRGYVRHIGWGRRVGDPGDDTRA